MIIETRNPQSNGKLIAAELQRQGHEVQTLSLWDSVQSILEQINNFLPQVVIGTHTHACLSAKDTNLIKISQSKPLMVLWYCDGYSPRGPEAGQLFQETAGIYDLSLIAVQGLLQDFRAVNYSPRLAWTPQYFDNIFFRPTIPRTDEYDVCFLGNIYPAARHRLDYIAALEQRFKVLKGGNGLGQLLYGTECANAYMRSKIAIDIPNKLPRIEMLFSDRIYRAMGLGCLFLSQHVIGIEQMFKLGVHLDMYDNTIQGLCNKVRYYLDRSDELKHIARAGQQEILTYHTISVRVKQYLAEIALALGEKGG